MTEETNNIGVFKAPSDIHFMGYEKATNSLIPHASVELMKMSRDGIWVNPDIPVEETAKQVLEILDNALKNMVRIAVAAEREACAYLCDRVAEEDRYADEQAELCAFAIRQRKE
jgi:hypothetical protein